MVIAFLGDILLISLLAYFVFSTSYSFEIKVQVLIIVVATLLGTAATLYVIHNLLAPITLTFLIHQYLKSRKLPNFPTKFTDEAGIVIADIYHTLTKLDKLIENLANYDKLTGLPN